MNGYIMTLNGTPIARSDTFKVKLTRKQKEAYKKMRTRKNASGSISINWDLDPYKEFKNKMKEQAK